jgi:hypothetical protein
MHPKNTLFQKREIKHPAVKAVPINCYVAGKIHIIVAKG